MAMQCGIGSRRSMGGIAKTVSALKILGGLKYLVVMEGGWYNGTSQNTPAKETPIKGTFAKNEGLWGVGEKLGTVEDGGWWRGGLQTPILPGGAGWCGYILFAQIFAPHFLQHYPRRKHSRIWQRLVV